MILSVNIKLFYAITYFQTYFIKLYSLCSLCSNNVVKQLQCLSRTADSISEGDLVSQCIWRSQKWGLLPVQVPQFNCLGAEGWLPNQLIETNIIKIGIIFIHVVLGYICISSARRVYAWLYGRDDTVPSVFWQNVDHQ